ncbi:MAG: acetyl-CoA carboxylase biotin carboxylase subunit [Bacteroidetes bacterium]|nr:acetyl-CoA carboxylase biotin carboxylase subunit [Bacteroidota bacterium]
MFNKILIANRGEIAVRIIRLCRDLGITSAAIYSDADKTSQHTILADESYNIGPAVSAESYLNQKKIINLAKDIGADAIHPGYGFFAENSEFIEACEKANITFIGPSSYSVKMMGNKTAARKLMNDHGVKIVPGTTKPLTSVKEGMKESKRIGFPVLLKAVAGGGGKGMRKINNESEFESAFKATKREALNAFSNDDIYLEKFIEQPKHIEVQILGDKKGNYIHLFERECSIQRRHQKIIEEAPSSIDEKTRAKITRTAINAAKACKYYNAGTVEFLMDKNNNFYFLEMNTRLQVEHPVTEFITGIDIVKEQLAIAAGNKLSIKQSELKINGHALECRIYAEDALNNFLPSTGRIVHYKAPSGPGVRLDSGFEQGSEISIYYDPLISKLVTSGADREISINRMKRALNEYQIAGVTTNIPFLELILEHPSFINGSFDINFIENEFLSGNNFLSENSKEFEEAAILISALLKNKPVNGFVKNNIANNNRWQEQMYE